MQCEGERRQGGALTLGPVVWRECEEEAQFLITVVQDGKEETFFTCLHCWLEAIATKGIAIVKVVPLELMKEKSE